MICARKRGFPTKVEGPELDYTSSVPQSIPIRSLNLSWFRVGALPVRPFWLGVFGPRDEPCLQLTHHWLARSYSCDPVSDPGRGRHIAPRRCTLPARSACAGAARRRYRPPVLVSVSRALRRARRYRRTRTGRRRGVLVSSCRWFWSLLEPGAVLAAFGAGLRALA